MRKNVIFMIINMNVGGTERALLNMIAEMPRNKYDITILMLEKYGGFLESIPPHVHKKYLNGYQDMKAILSKPPKEVIKTYLKKGRLIKALRLFILLLTSKITKNNTALFNYVLKNYPNLANEYDVAIAYAGPMDFISYFVVNKIKAKRRIQWIHFDVTKIGFNIDFATKTYQHFDKIYTVSEEGKNKLVKVLPNLKHKIEPYLNVISPYRLLKMSYDGPGFEDQFAGLRILTVGRLSKEKGQDLMISVVAKLKKSGVKIRFYCIGDGNAKDEYMKLISRYGVEEDFILLGSKINPYPFMRQCDIYVQPSRHEGYCITLAEAKCFVKPIICTNFTGANEQIVNGTTGIVVSFNEKEMGEALESLINDRQLRNELKGNLNNLKKDKSKESEIAYLV